MRVRIPWQQPHPFRSSVTEWEIDLARTALVLMDFQAAYVRPDVGLGARLAPGYREAHAYYVGRLREVVLPNATRLLAAFRQAGLQVIFTRLGTQLPDGRDLPPWSWRAALLRAQGGGTRALYSPEAAEYGIVQELSPGEEDLVLDRPTLSPFNSSPFDQCLRNLNIENLVIAGPLTEGAPETTARGAGERGYTVFLVEDACASLSPAEHEETFRNLSWCVGRTTDEMLVLLQPLLPGRRGAGVRSPRS